MVHVLYVRHGQSVWNKEQKAALASGASAEEIRRLGDLPRYVDAPLSAEGVAQALALRSRLVNEPEQGGELGRAVRCSIDGECAPPNVLTSNLRRAIDTALLGLRPLLEAVNTSVQSLPALRGYTCRRHAITRIARRCRLVLAAALSRRPSPPSPPYCTRLLFSQRPWAKLQARRRSTIFVRSTAGCACVSTQRTTTAVGSPMVSS